MNEFYIRDVRWLAPDSGQDITGHVRIAQGVVTPCDQLGSSGSVLDGRGLWLMPGMIDLGQHLAAPGPIQPASVKSELKAAWHNGFTHVCAAPDTQPVMDTASIFENISRHLSQQASADLSWLGALTLGLDGQQLSNMSALRDAGCAGYSQAGAAIPAPDVLRLCLRYAADLNMPVHLSARTAELGQGCAHDATLATSLGLTGIPVASETVALGVILALVEEIGTRVHVTRLSSAAGARMIAEARSRGLPVSADVAIWNLSHTDAALAEYNAQFHLQPPLRAESDRQALVAHVADGSISAICSSHHPHGHDAKFGPFPETLPGASSLDGFLAQLLQMVKRNELTALQMAQRTSAGPASVLDRTELRSNWLLVDPEHHWQLSTDTLYSAAHNHPLMGQRLQGCTAGWLSQEGWLLQQPWQARLGV